MPQVPLEPEERPERAAERSGSGAPHSTRSGPPVHEAERLLEGGTTALIRLGAKVYQLRLTRQGKLILTK